ncbi:DUF6705 family protein [Psychroflexus montanilacus]|uniref:DUF6705 family protein n=1 Tax=Psychroflexus montanilacus TaxID=2873598 RepID=UPI001CC931A6|nr:DUF6705 family protein [Psychroflexus montanilacus]MBZ9652205.1 hypothetical protein [Psychroflexus montanilacus]
MKTIYLLLLLSTLGLNAQIQQAGVVPLEEYAKYKTDDDFNLQNVDYFKDINNRLDKYTGTWTGTYDDNTLTLKVSILEKVEGLGIAFDELLIKYSIVKDNGEVLINTLDEHQFYRYHINGSFFAETTSVYLAKYTGLQWECNQKGYAILWMQDEATIKFWISPDNDMIGEECPLGNIHIMPTSEEEAVLLTKQN